MREASGAASQAGQAESRASWSCSVASDISLHPVAVVVVDTLAEHCAVWRGGGQVDVPLSRRKNKRRAKEAARVSELGPLVVAHMGGATNGDLKRADRCGIALTVTDHQHHFAPVIIRGHGPVQRLLCIAITVKALRGNIAVLDLKPRKGADGFHGHKDIDRDDNAKGPQGDQQHMAASQFARHHSLLPWKTVPIRDLFPSVASSTHSVNSLCSLPARAEPFSAVI